MQDPQQAQQAAQQAFATMAPMFAVIGLFGIFFWLFQIFLYWRMFAKAGFPGALGLIAILPGLGAFICNCILAFGRWNVVPAAPVGYNAYPPQYPPPPPSYPPANYPPQG